MFIYNLHNQKYTQSHLKEAEHILQNIPHKYCFITGSFLYKEKYKDIDLFILSRSKKKFSLKNKKIKVTYIDFNDMHSLFYHSLTKSCIAKNILPQKDLKVTLADFWFVVNEAVPTIMNTKNKYHKNIRFLVLYTEYFRNGNVLDSFELSEKIKQWKNTKEILTYIQEEVPQIFQKKASFSYIKRFFYTQASLYKNLQEYKAQKMLYNLTHKITRGYYG